MPDPREPDGAPEGAFRRRGVRLQEVAARAGVSIATASRILNSGMALRTAARERVERAAAELGYVPHGAAQALSSRHWRTIGAIVPSLENSGFAIAVEALQRCLDASGYTLLLASSGYDLSRELRETRTLLARGIDGLVLVGGDRDPETKALIERTGIPCIETWTLALDRPCVGFDNAAAASLLTDYLLDLGHREFGMIAGVTRHNDRAHHRVAGVRASLRRYGLSIRRECLIERPYRIVEGQLALHTLMRSEPRPTAVICGNDQLAFGALIEAAALGLNVPRDVSIAGFNDLDFAAFLTPPLTTVHVPAAEIGERAGRFLLDSLAGRPTPDRLEVQTRLVVRASTARPGARQQDALMASESSS